MIFYEHTGSKWVEKSAEIQDVLFKLPYLFSSREKVILPLHIINSILRSGKYNVGMSGYFKWEPLDMSPIEYGSFIQELKIQGFRNLGSIPSWVTDYKTWHIWKLEKLYGIDSEQHLKLADEIDELSDHIRVATESGDKKLVESLRVKKSRAQLKLVAFKKSQNSENG